MGGNDQCQVQDHSHVYHLPHFHQKMDAESIDLLGKNPLIARPVQYSCSFLFTYFVFSPFVMSITHAVVV